MSHQDDFEFWCSEYRDNPNMAEAETLRLLKSMCDDGNSVALDFFQKIDSALCNVLPPHKDAVDLLQEEEVVANLAPEFNFDDLDGEELGVQMRILEPREQRHDSTTRESASYPEDWSDIASNLKDERGRRCEVCGFCSYTGLIQVHHIDRDKADNSPANLQVLCAICHGSTHGSTPLWPIGTSESDKQELIKHHANQRANAIRFRRPGGAY